MLICNEDGTVTHDGCYNPWEHADKELMQQCKESGGFVMRIGTVDISTGIHHNDGLQYVILELEK